MTRKQRILLFGGLALALVVILLFGFQLVRRFINWPTNEPIREWMSVPYIAHSYHVPPRVLFDALGLPDQPRDMRPLREMARAQSRNVSDLITLLQNAIEVERKTRRPGGNQPEPPPTAPTLVPTPTQTSAG